MNCALVGSLLENYTTSDTDRPKLGSIYLDPKTGKRYRFVKNVSSTALAAKMVCIVSDASANEVTMGNTLSDPKVAGVRPSGADSLAQNEMGWIQTHGNATCIYGDSARATVAGEGVVHDDDSDKGKIGGVLLDTTATVNEANTELVITSMQGVFGRAQAAVSGAADQDVEVELDCKGFGS